MSILPLPSDDGKPKPALGVPMLAAGEFPEGLPTFHPQCKIFSIQKLAERDAALRKQGMFVAADQLRSLVARALCYPHPAPAHLLGGVA